MATSYTTVCDRCGKNATSDKDSAMFNRNHYRLDLCNHWLDDSKDLTQELKSERELDFDLCWDCAKLVADAVKSVLKVN